MSLATSHELGKLGKYKLVGGKPDTVEKDHGLSLTFISNDIFVLIEVKIPNIAKSFIREKLIPNVCLSRSQIQRCLQFCIPKTTKPLKACA